MWWAVLGFAAGQLVGGLLGTVVAVASGTPASKLTTSVPVVLAGEIGLWAGLLGACLLVSRRYGTRSLGRDFGLGFKPVDIFYGLGAAIAALAVDIVVSSAFLHTRFHGSNTQLLTGQRNNNAAFAVVTLIVAVGAPFFEELFFRGLIRTALLSRLAPGAAVLGQAVLFGLAHYQPSNGPGNVSVIVGIAGIGLVLGIVAQRTGRLGAGMIGHGLFNLTVAVLAIAR